MADSPATRMSVPCRISVPPAIAGPSTAAISGLVSRKPLSSGLMTVGSYSPDSKLSLGGFLSAALRSMPAQK